METSIFDSQGQYLVAGSGRKSNSSKLFYVLVTCKYKKTAEKREDVVFPNVSLWDFFQRSRAANSIVGGPNLLKFKLIQDFIHLLLICKFQKDRINSNREKMVTSIF